jgi:hypothetical protein
MEMPSAKTRNAAEEFADDEFRETDRRRQQKLVGAELAVLA